MSFKQNNHKETHIMKELLGKIDLNRFQRDLVYEFEIDQSSPWLNSLLLEINESSGLSPEEFTKESSIQISLKLKKINDSQLQDTALIEYSFKANYFAQSVKDLKKLAQCLEYEASLCFIHESFKNDETYKEETELFLDNKMYELYFSDKGKANLSEAIHEQTFLNFNFYPKQEESE